MTWRRELGWEMPDGNNLTNDEDFDAVADEREEKLASYDTVCDHGCEREGTIAHGDGRMLCRPCYMVETEPRDSVAEAMRAQDPYCPTCSPREASNPAKRPSE